MVLWFSSGIYIPTIHVHIEPLSIYKQIHIILHKATANTEFANPLVLSMPYIFLHFCFPFFFFCNIHILCTETKLTIHAMPIHYIHIAVYIAVVAISYSRHSHIYILIYTHDGYI